MDYQSYESFMRQVANWHAFANHLITYFSHKRFMINVDAGLLVRYPKPCCEECNKIAASCIN
ncbi:hypothetical protein Hgul01_04034 [Herpetosiphon gulosus]|uniref:Uncharacterized protein n=1 Tax=Herpetosiphon gulosus TaxID=1973496 RepID=A0ABP9X733_9CHLR